MRVLVTYGRHTKTLAAVRSIGRSGRNVVVIDSRSSPLCSFSKYCAGFFLSPSPEHDSAGYLDFLAKIIAAERIDLLIPMDDPECDLLSTQENASRLGCLVALPPSDSYLIARDKNSTVELAQELGIQVPKSFVVNDANSASQIPRLIGLPAIVKPVRGSGSRGFHILRESASLGDVAQLISTYGPLVAQEFVPHGGAIGVSYLLNQGRTRAVFSHKRLLEYPESGGPSIVRESIRQPEAEKAGRLLLEKMRWHGVAMVEFRTDSRTGKPILMEINPRFWGSLPLALACGIDFPRLLCDMYEKGDVPQVESYKTGVRCVNLLPFGAASILGQNGLRRFCEIGRNALACRCFDVESFEDPLPTIGALFSLFGYAMDRRKVESFYRVST
jgi:predicted ATP-grasp superfamily ATP-dependent carboligase